MATPITIFSSSSARLASTLTRPSVTIRSSGFARLKPVSTQPPSGKFAIGSTVAAAFVVNVRQLPAGTLVGFQSAGSSGKVIGGPITSNFNGVPVIWWQIAFAAAPNGWVGQDNLMQAIAPTPQSTFNAWTNRMNTQIGTGQTPVQLLQWINSHPPTSD